MALESVRNVSKMALTSTQGGDKLLLEGTPSVALESWGTVGDEVHCCCSVMSRVCGGGEGVTGASCSEEVGVAAVAKHGWTPG